jgi:hypothetical protein
MMVCTKAAQQNQRLRCTNPNSIQFHGFTFTTVAGSHTTKQQNGGKTLPYHPPKPLTYNSATNLKNQNQNILQKMQFVRKQANSAFAAFGALAFSSYKCSFYTAAARGIMLPPCRISQFTLNRLA